MTWDELIQKVEPIFKTLGFHYFEYDGKGMFAHAAFHKNNYRIVYSNDRGFVDFIAYINGKDNQRFDLIGLINWLHKDQKKYEYLTLGRIDEEESIRYFTEIFVKEFELLDSFFQTATQQDIDSFNLRQEYE